MGENWEKFWKNNSVIPRVVSFMRAHYFAKTPIQYMEGPSGKRILEAGCGTCETLILVADPAKKVVGLDISKKALSLAKKKFDENNVPTRKYSLVLGDIEKMKFSDNSFDITFNSGVIEHFDDTKINNTPVKEMIRVTKKGGKVIILVPSAYSLFYLYYLISRLPFLNKIYPWEEHRFYTIGMMKKQLAELGVKNKVTLNLRSTFLYLVAVVTKE